MIKLKTIVTENKKKALLKEISEEESVNETIKKGDKFTSDDYGKTINWWVVKHDGGAIELDNDHPKYSRFALSVKDFEKKVKNGEFKPINEERFEIHVNYIEVDTNFQNIPLQKQGVLDEFFLEEVIGDIEAYIDDSNITDAGGNSAFDITRLVSDLKFDCEIKIDNSEIDLTIKFDANGDILDVDIDDESIAEKYGITTETIMAHLESKGI